MKIVQFRRLIIGVSIVASTSLHAQNFFSYWGERWNDYLHTPESNLTFLHKRFFKDTVTVAEMKEAFVKYKGVTCEKSLYEGVDSVYFPIEGHGRSVMLVSPLQRHPDRNVRACRGIWACAGPRYQLLDVVDKNGKSQKKLLEKLNGDETKRWLDGEILRIEEPRWYMGFVVSPCVYWECYDEGKPLADVNTSANRPDFFSYAEVTYLCIGGRWYSHLQAGVRLLGAMCGLDYSPLNRDQAERVFSVLLYRNPLPKGKKRLEKPYTLELLEPGEADKETLRLFHDLKRFVESLPDKTFKPYYTTDFRIMNGRYYRVTVNRCGWLVEDYLKE